jgi:hypothetical protein
VYAAATAAAHGCGAYAAARSVQRDATARRLGVPPSFGLRRPTGTARRRETQQLAACVARGVRIARLCRRRARRDANETSPATNWPNRPPKPLPVAASKVRRLRCARAPRCAAALRAAARCSADAQSCRRAPSKQRRARRRSRHASWLPRVCDHGARARSWLGKRAELRRARKLLQLTTWGPRTRRRHGGDAAARTRPHARPQSLNARRSGDAQRGDESLLHDHTHAAMPALGSRAVARADMMRAKPSTDENRWLARAGNGTDRCVSLSARALQPLIPARHWRSVVSACCMSRRGVHPG